MFFPRFIPFFVDIVLPMIWIGLVQYYNWIRPLATFGVPLMILFIHSLLTIFFRTHCHEPASLYADLKSGPEKEIVEDILDDGDLSEASLNDDNSLRESRENLSQIDESNFFDS